MGVSLMAGMTMKSLKHHTALQPLALIMTGGIIFVAAYCARLASKTTDINWTKAKDLGTTWITTIISNSSGSTQAATTTPPCLTREWHLTTGRIRWRRGGY